MFGLKMIVNHSKITLLKSCLSSKIDPRCKETSCSTNISPFFQYKIGWPGKTMVRSCVVETEFNCQKWKVLSRSQILNLKIKKILLEMINLEMIRLDMTGLEMIYYRLVYWTRNNKSMLKNFGQNNLVYRKDLSVTVLCTKCDNNFLHCFFYRFREKSKIFSLS